VRIERKKEETDFFYKKKIVRLLGQIDLIYPLAPFCFVFSFRPAPTLTGSKSRAGTYVRPAGQ
jgi:hypothetical protein